MRTVKLVCGAVTVAVVLVAVAAAQTSVPRVAVTAGKGTITVAPAGPIAAGPTRFEFTKTGRGEVEVSLATLRAGVTLDQLRATLSRNPGAALSLAFLEASTTIAAQASTAAVTVDLRPNVTYVAVSTVGSTYGYTTLATTGTPNGAQAPAPDARIGMVDYGFRGPKTLPRNGSIRVDNGGTAIHFALAFPVRRGVSAKRVGRALRGGSEKAIGKVVAGAPVSVQDLISPGSSNTNEVRFGRPGRYAFVCFFGGHNRLGMYRIFTVR